MAVNDSRSINGDFAQGSVDNTYIQLAPDRGGVVENVPTERLQWPTYANAELWRESPFLEAHVRRLGHPVERKTGSGSDLRF